MELFIPSSQQVREGGKSYYVYKVEVRFAGWKNTLEKRYSEFLELHRVMKLLRRALHSPLPHFPGQHIWKQITGGLSDEDVEERRIELQNYMQALINSECAKNSTYFPEFVNLPENIRELWRTS
ncbi:hypothetical protein SteCoe_17570 [Stentor coeruleus]|uniref:PX domain-containing protein n=1 Tax=Stentor coeruleus TaxID=5963 RepID=A0A1R2BYQ1_9CILI|nr:hypothetical protein SteCoe_17570 [Stentor coeruleus]